MSSNSRRPAAFEAWIRLARATASAQRSIDARIERELGISLSEISALQHVERAPGGRLRRTDLADRLLVSQGGVTRLLAPLERRGLVERAPDPADGRVSLVVLTAEGERLVREAWPMVTRWARELFADRLDPDELATLTELLGRLPDAILAERSLDRPAVG